MPVQESFHTVICGSLQRETIINKLDQLTQDMPGGNLLYAASGHAILDKHVGLVSSSPFSEFERYSKELTENGFDTSGLLASPTLLPVHRFYHIAQDGKIETSNMKRHFFNRGLQIPKNLLAYEQEHSRIHRHNTPLSTMHSNNFPKAYQNTHTVLLTPMRDIAQYTCMPYLRENGVKQILLRSSPTYMVPRQLHKIHGLLCSADYFFTTKQEIKTLFKNRFDRYLDMIQALKSFGNTHIIIHSEKKGYTLLPAGTSTTISVPDYEVYVADPLGSYDCFCGAFAAGIDHEDFSQERSMLLASAAASVCKEGSGIHHILNTMPALLRMRAEYLSQQISYGKISSLVA